MIVADANLIVHRTLRDAYADSAERWAEAEPLWCVPSIWRFEYTNAITSHVRAGRLDPDAAARTIAQTVDALTENEYEVDQVDVFRAALRYRISPYDANYVLLAASLGTRCVTADRLMLERVPHLTRPISLPPT